MKGKSRGHADGWNGWGCPPHSSADPHAPNFLVSRSGGEKGVGALVVVIVAGRAGKGSGVCQGFVAGVGDGVGLLGVWQGRGV